MPVIEQDWIERSDLRNNPDQFYLFGDNEQRVGTGGQAKAMRGEPNAVGIRTKRTPGTNSSAYWSERDLEEFKSNVRMVRDDLLSAVAAVQMGRTVVIPRDGLGTGLAELSKRAPITLIWIEHALDELKRISQGQYDPPSFLFEDLDQFYEHIRGQIASSSPL